MKVIIIPVFLLLPVVALSCATTYDHKNPYPNMEIVHYGNSQAYVFNNDVSDKLIINIEGSGWTSVLGEKNEHRWLYTGLGAQMLQVLGDKYTLLIPEKLKRQPGIDYSKDTDDRSNYTFENIFNCYIESIDGYLNEHSFSSIILIGVSEGALVLPVIYHNMKMKDSVTAMVSMGYGGYSLYESFKILSVSPKVPQGYRDMYNSLIQAYEYIEAHKAKNSIVDMPPEEDIYGLNYRWYDSIMGIRPFDYYKDINIPVLFVHGDYDYNVSVESTVYIQKNLQEKPFEYLYYPWKHYPKKKQHIITWRNEFAEWIINRDK